MPRLGRGFPASGRVLYVRLVLDSVAPSDAETGAGVDAETLSILAFVTDADTAVVTDTEALTIGVSDSDFWIG